MSFVEWRVKRPRAYLHGKMPVHREKMTEIGNETILSRSEPPFPLAAKYLVLTDDVFRIRKFHFRFECK